MSKTMLLATLFTGACVHEVDVGAAPELQEETLILGADHEITFLGDANGNQLLVETSPEESVSLLDRYGAASAAAIYAAGAPAQVVPEFLRHPEPAAPDGPIARSAAALSKEEENGASGVCDIKRCVRYTTNYDPELAHHRVLKTVCAQDKLGGAQAWGYGTKVYAQIRAQSVEGIVLWKFAGADPRTAVLKPGRRLQFRGSERRGIEYVSRTNFEIQGRSDAAYDLYACYTGPAPELAYSPNY